MEEISAGMVLQVLRHSLSHFSNIGLYLAYIIAYMPDAGVQFTERLQDLGAGSGLRPVLPLAGKHPSCCQNANTHRPNRRNDRLNDAIIYTHGAFLPPQYGLA